MRKRLVLLVIAAGLVTATAASAEVNCKLVLSNLKTGRTPQDVADTMVISIDEVKKCQASDGAAGGSAPKAGVTGGASVGVGGSVTAPDTGKK